MAGRDNAKLRREADGEVLALAIWRQADGEIITRRTVESTLAAWREHPEGSAGGRFHVRRRRTAPVLLKFVS